MRQKMAKNILVVGSSNTDMIIKVPKIPKPGETILGGEFTTAAGGKGANQAVAAARAGGQVAFIARVGTDIFGDQAIKGFRQDHINVDNVRRDDKAPSGVALIFVAENGENSIAVASGANANLTPKDVTAASKAFQSADILIMQLETPIETIKAAAMSASQNGVPIILNPAPAQALDDDLLRTITILTPNESETELLTGIHVDSDAAAERAAKALRQRGVATVIITLGAKGCFVDSADYEGLIPGFKVRAVDTTAAGDVFNGALAVALAEGKPIADAVIFANAAAALSVTKLGAQPSAPSREEIEKLVAQSAAAKQQ
jgi:ribokinase